MWISGVSVFIYIYIYMYIIYNIYIFKACIYVYIGTLSFCCIFTFIYYNQLHLVNVKLLSCVELCVGTVVSVILDNFYYYYYYYFHYYLFTWWHYLITLYMAIIVSYDSTKLVCLCMNEFGNLLLIDKLDNSRKTKRNIVIQKLKQLFIASPVNT